MLLQKTVSGESSTIVPETRRWPMPFNISFTILILYPSSKTTCCLSFQNIFIYFHTTELALIKKRTMGINTLYVQIVPICMPLSPQDFLSFISLTKKGMSSVLFISGIQNVMHHAIVTSNFTQHEPIVNFLYYVYAGRESCRCQKIGLSENMYNNFFKGTVSPD
jgi:hypothetical protein